MIPIVNDIIEIEEVTQPSYTYYLDIENKRIRGYVDELESVRQAIYLILSTERYVWLIYSWNYGREFDNLIGQPMDLVLPELKRLIQEALLQDDRIESVDNFSFETGDKYIHVTFTAYTIYGETEIETEVLNV